MHKKHFHSQMIEESNSFEFYYSTNIQFYSPNSEFRLESGKFLDKIRIAYSTYGDAKNPTMWVCHALTANSDVSDWWEGMFGKGNFLDPSKYFIVCANVLGSCYGSTGPTNINPLTNDIYGHEFPELTIRDLVNAHISLRKHLNIQDIHCLVGASLGGHQALEWAIMESKRVRRLILIATNASFSPWGIAFNESQRMAIELDPTYYKKEIEGGKKGMETARSIALLSYRCYFSYQKTQTEETNDKVKDFKASSYQKHQGYKLGKRFSAHVYHLLSRTMDSHNVGRNRKSIEYALSLISAKTIIIGIKSDLLFPIDEQKFIAKHIRNCQFFEISSLFGHDGFLIEKEMIGEITIKFLNYEER